MDTDIRIIDTDLTQAFRAYVERRLHFSLGRFGRRVGRVTVRIADLNGLRGGVDKSCYVSVELMPSGETLVQRAVDANLYAAISRAIQGIGRTFARALGRNHQRKRKRETIRFPLQALGGHGEPLTKAPRSPWSARMLKPKQGRRELKEDIQPKSGS